MDARTVESAIQTLDLSLAFQEWFVQQVTNVTADPFDGIPKYHDIYLRWERQHWCVQDVDLTRDRSDWLATSPAERQQWFYLAAFAHFRASEAKALDILGPYLSSFPALDARMALSCQAVDESRHAAFFQRYYDEVLIEAVPEQALQPSGSEMSPSFRYLFVDAVDEAAAAVRANPSPETLVRAVMLSHIFLEGAFALATFQLLRRVLERANKFPGLARALSYTGRDEARHVHVGLRAIREALLTDPGLEPVLVSRVNELLPHLLRILQVHPGRKAALEKLGIDPFQRRRDAVAHLRRHLRTMGLACQVEDPTPFVVAA